MADGLARLFGSRGDVTRLKQLWARDGAEKLVAGWRPDEHEDALQVLRRALDANLVVQRKRDGTPKSFRPLVPEFVTAAGAGDVYREMGRAVNDALWADPVVRAGVHRCASSWRNGHPIAAALAGLCPAVREPASEPSHLANLLSSGSDPALVEWVNTCVAEDWRAWIRAAESLSVDEQLESMTALACLHLHVALLQRLSPESRSLTAEGHDGVRSQRGIFFAVVAGGEFDPACARAAYHVFAMWSGRANDALRLVAGQQVDKVCAAQPDYGDFSHPRNIAAWTSASIVASKRTNERFRESLIESSQGGRQDGRTAVIDALVHAFSPASGVATKVRDFLRTSGRAVGIVGPDTRNARKRYQLDDRGISLLARLHAHRGDEVHSGDTEAMSINAFLDDVFYRYGLVVTAERGGAKHALRSESAKPLAMRMPPNEAMRRNRANLERRLDDLRLVRRYSDDSAVIHVR